MTMMMTNDDDHVHGRIYVVFVLSKSEGLNADDDFTDRYQTSIRARNQRINERIQKTAQGSAQWELTTA